MYAEFNISPLQMEYVARLCVSSFSYIVFCFFVFCFCFFVFISHLQSVKYHYDHIAKRDTSLKVVFQRSEITLDIPEDGQLTHRRDGKCPILV